MDEVEKKVMEDFHKAIDDGLFEMLRENLHRCIVIIAELYQYVGSLDGIDKNAQIAALDLLSNELNRLDGITDETLLEKVEHDLENSLIKLNR